MGSADHFNVEALPDADQFSVVVDFTVLHRAHTYVAGGTGALFMNGNSSVALSCSELREISTTLRTSATRQNLAPTRHQWHGTWTAAAAIVVDP